MKQRISRIVALIVAVVMSVGIVSFDSWAKSNSWITYEDGKRDSCCWQTVNYRVGDKATVFLKDDSDSAGTYDIFFQGDEATFEGNSKGGVINSYLSEPIQFMSQQTGATNPFTLNLTKSIKLNITDNYDFEGEDFFAFASVLKLKGNGTLSLGSYYNSETGKEELINIMGLYCASDLYIDGVNLVIKTRGSCGLSVHDINISSGSIDITASNAGMDGYGCIVYNKLNLGEGMGIVEPENAIIKENSYGESVIYNSDGSIAKHVRIAKKSSSSDGSGSGSSSNGYSNEWAGGKWYDADGSQTYTGTLSWKSDASGWWVEDSSGWYPKSQWQKIDGIWYFFKPDGYMASNEYYNGYWFNKDGSWDEKYFLSWKSNATGWWVEDKSGWWPASSWLKIDGYWYYFDASGYMVTNQYVDGWWISADGVCY